jgi:hypothetical protein
LIVFVDDTGRQITDEESVGEESVVDERRKDPQGCQAVRCLIHVWTPEKRGGGYSMTRDDTGERGMSGKDSGGG